LTFTLTPQSGSSRIVYAGGSGPLQGNILGTTSVTGLDTPNHTGKSFELDAGTGSLSFQTGPSAGISQGGTEWNFGTGGAIELDGGIQSLGIPAGTKLLTGSFTNPTFVKDLGAGDLKVQGGAFFNVVNPTLAAYFGLPTGGTMYLGGLSTLFSAGTTIGGAFSSESLTSGSVTTQPVPEPGALVVFASLASSGIAYVYRRRRHRTA
jgi:hypothetical protein